MESADMENHFGEHITIDGYGGSVNLLDSETLVRSMLNELPTLLGMKILAPANVYHANGNNAKDLGGWTGVVVIEESHISIHTFPMSSFVSVDVYTCQNGLDVDFVKNYFIGKFSLIEVEINYFKRGKKFYLYHNKYRKLSDEIVRVTK
jgi:S-adenosylmethionine decarboxylase proenzyme